MVMQFPSKPAELVPAQLPRRQTFLVYRFKKLWAWAAQYFASYFRYGRKHFVFLSCCKEITMIISLWNNHLSLCETHMCVKRKHLLFPTHKNCEGLCDWIAAKSLWHIRSYIWGEKQLLLLDTKHRILNPIQVICWRNENRCGNLCEDRVILYVLGFH